MPSGHSEITAYVNEGDATRVAAALTRLCLGEGMRAVPTPGPSGVRHVLSPFDRWTFALFPGAPGWTVVHAQPWNTLCRASATGPSRFVDLCTALGVRGFMVDVVDIVPHGSMLVETDGRGLHRLDGFYFDEDEREETYHGTPLDLEKFEGSRFELCGDLACAALLAERNSGLESRDRRGGQERGAAGAGGGEAELEALRPDGGGGDDFSSPRERVLALAGTRADSELAGRAGGGRVPQAGRDRSLEALQRQVGAMESGLGAVRFELEVRGADGKATQRAWTRAELESLKTVSWLKRMNAKGGGVFIRPAGDHGLVLVDELKAEGVDRMKGSGFAPAVTLETSPGVYQAWVKLADGALAAEVRELAAHVLAKGFGGAAVTDGQPYGRLAGFTNWQRAQDGRPPYVLAHDGPGQVAAQAPQLLQVIGQTLEQAAAKRERERRLEAVRTAPAERLWGHGPADPVHEYRRQARRLLERYGVGADLSRVDWMIAQDMAKGGRFTVGQIAQGLREGSPNVESRKAGHVDDYAQRTAAKAWASPEVLAYREEQARKSERRIERGRDGYEWYLTAKGLSLSPSEAAQWVHWDGAGGASAWLMSATISSRLSSE